MRRTKIMVTLGPSSMQENVIYSLVKSGTDVFRLNFSHGTLEEKDLMIRMIRKIEESSGKLLPILADLRGPSLRLGTVKKFFVKRGEEVVIRLSGKGLSSRKEVPIPYSEVFEVLEEGDIVLIDDGKVRVKIEKILDDRIRGKVLSEGEIRSHVTFAVQGKDPPLPTLTEKDLKDIKFAIERGVEFFALSFVRSAKDVRDLRRILGEYNAYDAKIISKIETKSAIDNLDKIINTSDGIMIARGDLGMHFPLEEVPHLQEKIARRCLEMGKPSILATQILESMVERPMPTRAEVADVYAAVKQGVSALMLSSETAIGKYPVEAVKWLDTILRYAESKIPPPKVDGINETIYDKFAKGIVLLAESINAKIIAYTKKGATAYRISRYRPRTETYIATADKRVARQINLLWGLIPMYTPDIELEAAIVKVFEDLRRKGILRKGDIAILTVGMREGATDLARIEIIE